MTLARIVLTQMNQPPAELTDVVSGITASPGGQGGATALTGRVNIVTGIAADTAVRVQVVGVRQQQVVLARGGRDLPVYPPSGHEFEGYGTNAYVIVPDLGMATFTFDGDSTWHVS